MERSKTYKTLMGIGTVWVMLYPPIFMPYIVMPIYYYAFLRDVPPPDWALAPAAGKDGASS